MTSSEHTIDLESVNDNKGDECCVCLETITMPHVINTNCCKTPFHEKCLFRLFLSGFNHCPMCRSSTHINHYFDLSDVQRIYKSFSEEDKNKHISMYNIILYNQKKMTLFVCGFRFEIAHPMFWIRVLMYSLLRTKRYLLFIFLVYIFIFLLVYIENEIVK